MSEHLQQFISHLQRSAPQGRICIAFSNGVDSTVLLKVAKLAGLSVLAVTFDTQLTHTDINMQKANETALALGAEHLIVPIDMLADERIASNDLLRCYYCKAKMFTHLQRIAQEKGIDVICDGTNADDLKEYRPGLLAKAEAGVISPIADCNLTKQDVRDIAKALSLSVASKPSAPCHLTRFPYGTKITSAMITTVRQGEDILHHFGFAQCRLRVIGDLAKIEIPKTDFTRFLAQRDEISSKLKKLGFTYITLDVDGLRSGSMDQKIRKEG